MSGMPPFWTLHLADRNLHHTRLIIFEKGATLESRTMQDLLNLCLNMPPMGVHDKLQFSSCTFQKPLVLTIPVVYTVAVIAEWQSLLRVCGKNHLMMSDNI